MECRLFGDYSEMTILKDVSLCAIVRDEMINPAGGIERFVHSHVPFCEQAVIVDTGSIDGTREKLEELASQYKNLKIYDYKFDGYAQARNFSLNKAKTKLVLCLDADELITHEQPEDNWERLQNILDQENKYKKVLFSFEIKDVCMNDEEYSVPCFSRKLFSRKNANFEGIIHEINNYSNNSEIIATGIPLFHFLPTKESLQMKNNEFYQLGYGPLFKKEIISKGIAPSQIASFPQWKAYNPKRDNYI